MSRGALVDRCDRCGALLVKMTPAQHAAAEAVYEDIANAGIDYPRGSGDLHDVWGWHQIMVAAFAKEQDWQPKMVALEGGGWVMVTRTKQSRLTKRQGSELIEFAKAYAAERGVHVRGWDEDGNLISDPMRKAA